MKEEIIESKQSENTEIHQIYDRIFKKALTLSTKAVINFINGLYKTDYPLDSTIDYNWTEHHDNELHRTLADTIITINHCHSYHMEAQMTKDENLVFRVFQYGFHHAVKARDRNPDFLEFPEPCIIYLSKQVNIPEYQTITIHFSDRQEIVYRVPTFCYQEHDIEELNNRKMIILIPFQLLKLKKIIDRNSSPENIERLKKLITDDIIKSIELNYKAGNITQQDGLYLIDLVRILYQHLYGANEACRKEGIYHMITEPLILPTEYRTYIREQEIKRLETELAEQSTKLTEQREKLIKQDAIIADLKAQLASKN